tara:strand:- start:519 stop:752 length:234 start_codon:yes stop_codon:yes gene_type:complete
MPETITEEELKDAIAQWAPKFNLIRELWPGASIEESLNLLSVIEDKAEDLKEEDKSPMGFVSKKKDKTRKNDRSPTN